MTYTAICQKTSIEHLVQMPVLESFICFHVSKATIFWPLFCATPNLGVSRLREGSSSLTCKIKWHRNREKWLSTCRTAKIRTSTSEEQSNKERESLRVRERDSRRERLNQVGYFDNRIVSNTSISHPYPHIKQTLYTILYIYKNIAWFVAVLSLVQSCLEKALLVCACWGRIWTGILSLTSPPLSLFSSCFFPFHQRANASLASG